MAQPHEVPLGLINNQLSHLHHALDKLFSDRLCTIKLVYRGGRHGLGLQVEIEIKEKFAQQAVDRLAHGALHGPYDFRFRMIGRELNPDPDAWVWVTAMPDTQHLPNGKPEKRAYKGMGVASRVISLYRQGYASDTIGSILDREFV